MKETPRLLVLCLIWVVGSYLEKSIDLYLYGWYSFLHVSYISSVVFLIIKKGKKSFLELYTSPEAAVTKYHKLGSLDQKTFIVSQFWLLEV